MPHDGSDGCRGFVERTSADKLVLVLGGSYARLVLDGRKGGSRGY